MPEKCAETCPQLEELKQDVRALREQGRETHKELFARINSIEKTNAVQDERYKSTMDKLDEISKKQESISAQIASLEAKPGKKWDDMMGQIIAAVVAAVVGLIIGRFGL